VRRRAPRPIAFALDDLRDRLAPPTTLAAVQAAWPGVVGAAIARQAVPVAERGGVLRVACRSSVWAQELDLMALDITRRLNAVLGGDAVRSLRCVVGEGPR
jgi:predicted nucleic acid-binding Zn ribbon protein